ncbi:MAG: YdcF family protein [Oceanicaulis sp.]
MNRLAAVIRGLAFVVLFTFALGFALFLREARTMTPDETARADAIVVLTGGEERVVTGVRLLKNGKGRRLLISGVNPGVPPADIAAAAGASAELFNCCIDTGAEALDTIGNAQETARWAALNAYDSLIVVTNDYHMPRALLELQAAMPDTRLLAYAVPTEGPFSETAEARRWLQEYAKYAAVFVRVRAAGLRDALD